MASNDYPVTPDARFPRKVRTGFFEEQYQLDYLETEGGGRPMSKSPEAP